jgi:hypothetical protein
VFPVYVNTPVLLVIESDPDNVLFVKVRPPVLLVTDPLPVTVLLEIVVPPALLETLTEPFMALLESTTPSRLPVRLALPPRVSLAQPEPPMTTGPLVPVTETDPVTVVPHSVIPSALVELSDPPIDPPLTQRAPPAPTVTDPVTFPPEPMQMTCPFATLSDPLSVEVMQAWVNPTVIVPFT